MCYIQQGNDERQRVQRATIAEENTGAVGHVGQRQHTDAVGHVGQRNPGRTVAQQKHGVMCNGPNMVSDETDTQSISPLNSIRSAPPQRGENAHRDARLVREMFGLTSI